MAEKLDARECAGTAVMLYRDTLRNREFVINIGLMVQDRYICDRSNNEVRSL